jgi:hypothetical protein
MLSDSVQAFIDREVAASPTDFSDLRAVFLNGTLKRSPDTSHTEALIDISRHIMGGLGARVEVVRYPGRSMTPGSGPTTARPVAC